MILKGINFFDCLQIPNNNTFQDHVGQVLKVSFNSTSQQLVSAGEDNTIRVWEKVNQKNQGRYRSIFQVDQESKINQYAITDVIFSPDDQFIVNSDNMGYVMFWNLGQNKQTALWQASPYTINTLHFSSEDDLLVTIADQKESTLTFPLQSLDELITTGCRQIGDFLQSQSKLLCEK
jgi:WD40 repeat protein